MTLKDRLIIYTYNKSNRIEAESEHLKHSIRYRAMDSLDMYELMLDKIRISAWNEFLDELYSIVIYGDIGSNKFNEK
ncbi:MAG: hypothetical protein IKK24_03025 [Clostridia bacterium]|nr:hypothetical protein [Clostridia bacterium]